MSQPANDIRYLWRNMPTDTVIITAEGMRARARKFQTGVRVRNSIEYIAFVIVVAAFSYQAWNAPNWQASLAGVLMIIGASVAVWNLYRRGRAVATPVAASAKDLIAFQRGELVRQRDVLVSVWRWYLMPFVPGFAYFSVIAWMGYLENDMPLAEQQAKVIGFVAVLAAVFAISILLNLLGAAHLQRRIEDLDRYTEKK